MYPKMGCLHVMALLIRNGRRKGNLTAILSKVDWCCVAM